MVQLTKRFKSRLGRHGIEHSGRTAVAAITSLGAAEALGFPEPYWASITAIIVTQSTLGAAWTISVQRFFGTALGAAMGALLWTYFGASLIAYGCGVFVLGLLCLLLGLERSGYRYAGIALAVIMLIQRSRPVWIIALHRFVEVSVGIVIGLILTALWPERETAIRTGSISGR
jgi:uncharacterized membrane protein YgaE (UPF0421/DUF939 family)